MSYRIEDVFTDRAVLITGASGFLGKVLMEKIMYSIPRVGRIYLLIRPSKGLGPRDRLDKILESTLFDRVRKECPHQLSKLVPVAGNLMEDQLGLNQHDLQSICDEVAIVFHCAATVKFDEQLRDAVEMNVLGTTRLVALCHKLQNLVVLVHTSTAYANCDLSETEEKVYAPPVAPQKLLEALEWMDDEMINLITPKLLGQRPNTYTLTKSLAETQLVEDAGQLPVIVLRPSIVGAIWQEPLPGWTDNINGPTGIFAAVGKGVLTNMCGSVKSKADIIPVDVVSNMLIAAAAHRVMTKYTEIPIMHCASGDLNPCYWQRIVCFLEQFYHQYPMDQCFAVPSTHFHTSRMLFELNYNVKHHFPAIALDQLGALVGKKKMYVRLYSKVWKMIETLHYFTTRGWTFKSKALPILWDEMHPEDKKVFNFDIRQLDWDSYLFDYVMGVKKYIVKDKIENLAQARRNLSWLKTMKMVLTAGFWMLIVRVFGRKYNVKQRIVMWLAGIFTSNFIVNYNKLKGDVRLKSLEEYKRTCNY